MSKIGQKILQVPSTVSVVLENNNVRIKGKEGELTIFLPNGIVCKKDEKTNDYNVLRKNDSKEMKALHGLFRSLIANAIIGVEKPWEKKLEVMGTGYTVKMEGQNLLFKVGYSHPVGFPKIEGVQYSVEGNSKVTIKGIDKQLVGEVAYKIKMIKKPDVYKGKGIKYENEKLRIKPGKKAKAA